MGCLMNKAFELRMKKEINWIERVKFLRERERKPAYSVRHKSRTIDVAWLLSVKFYYSRHSIWLCCCFRRCRHFTVLFYLYVVWMNGMQQVNTSLGYCKFHSLNRIANDMNFVLNIFLSQSDNSSFSFHYLCFFFFLFFPFHSCNPMNQTIEIEVQ